jgi:ABC-type Na+ efflux pump permease subunit
MNAMQIALIKKDIRAIVTNKRLLAVLLIVPLMMTVIIPALLIFIAGVTPLESSDLQALIALNEGMEKMTESELREMAIKVLFDEMTPIFFMMVPLISASVMAASSFVGEKEKRTLETLLYCPLSVRQIFNAKTLAALLLSQFVSLLSFAVMMVVVQLELWLLFGYLIVPALAWPILLFLVSPALSLVAISLVVGGSAKAKTVEESQQRSAFLVIPIVLLLAMQFGGIQVFSLWILLVSGFIFLLIGLILLRRLSVKFSYEALLR